MLGLLTVVQFFTVMLCVENIICQWRFSLVFAHLSRASNRPIGVHFGDGKHLLALTVPNIVKIGQVIPSHNRTNLWNLLILKPRASTTCL